jgi:hypothetical protein
MSGFSILALAALVPTIVGFIYYHPSVMGGVWQRTAGISADDPKPNMAMVVPVTLFFSLLLSVMIWQMVIHQNGLNSMLADVPDLAKPESELSIHVKYIMDNYGMNYRSFKHGVFHGVLISFFFVLPVLSMGALYERKSFGYIGVHLLYWILTLSMMGGLICGFF